MFKETFKALSDPIRREILVMLKERRMNVGEIGKQFNITGATLSYHLNILKSVGFIRESKEKNFVYYEINLSVFEELILWFNNFKGDDENEK